MGRILFLSIAAYLAYRYIARSNKKAQQITGAAGTVEILPPEDAIPPSRQIERGAAAEVTPVARTSRPSAAVETDPGRR